MRTILIMILIELGPDALKLPPPLKIYYKVHESDHMQDRARHAYDRIARARDRYPYLILNTIKKNPGREGSEYRYRSDPREVYLNIYTIYIDSDSP